MRQGHVSYGLPDSQSEAGHVAMKIDSSASTTEKCLYQLLLVWIPLWLLVVGSTFTCTRLLHYFFHL